MNKNEQLAVRRKGELEITKGDLDCNVFFSTVSVSGFFGTCFARGIRNQTTLRRVLKNFLSCRETL